MQVNKPETMSTLFLAQLLFIYRAGRVFLFLNTKNNSLAAPETRKYWQKGRRKTRGMIFSRNSSRQVELGGEVLYGTSTLRH